ncbi:MAG: hypothetical protein AAGC53_11240 [Actinomycetota bacterium]
MQLDDALRVLDLEHTADWAAVKNAHRRAIIASHPDVGGSTEAAARINQAFEYLRAVTDDGTEPLPRPATPSPVRRMHEQPRVDHDNPREVLLRLADVAHDLGEVVFVDPDAGLLEVVVGDEPGVGQLTASIDVDRPGADGVPVSFTLEPLGVAPAPPIAGVVDALMTMLGQTRRAPNPRR